MLQKSLPPAGLMVFTALHLPMPPAFGQFPQPESPVACDEGVIQEPVALRYGDHTSGCEFVPATDLDQFVFEGTSADLVRFNLYVPSGPINPVMELRDPTGAPVELAPDSCNGQDCSFQTQLSLSMTGTYRIVLSDGGTNRSGTYVFLLERIHPPPQAPQLFYDVTVEDTFSPPTDLDFLAFVGKAGTEVRFSVFIPSGPLNPLLELFDPAGTPIDLTPNSCNGQDCSFQSNLTLPMSGVYHVILSDGGTNRTGTYQIGLQCLFGPCPTDEILPTEPIFSDHFELTAP